MPTFKPLMANNEYYNAISSSVNGDGWRTASISVAHCGRSPKLGRCTCRRPLSPPGSFGAVSRRADHWRLPECCTLSARQDTTAIRWDEMRWVELRWVELSWDELSWDEMRKNEMKWSALKWFETSRVRCSRARKVSQQIAASWRWICNKTIRSTLDWLNRRLNKC